MFESERAAASLSSLILKAPAFHIAALQGESKEHLAHQGAADLYTSEQSRPEQLVT